MAIEPGEIQVEAVLSQTTNTCCACMLITLPAGRIHVQSCAVQLLVSNDLKHAKPCFRGLPAGLLHLKN